MKQIIITNAKYIEDLTGNKSCIKTILNNIEMFVPIDPNNRHYQAILEWVAEGNKIEEAD
tara:strand:+ start:2035 stop:2214 length:180 start_codon:yes stop_codon:yes gene_type:complete